MTNTHEGEKDKDAKDKDQDWRKLCELVAREQDPQRLSELVEQLIQKLDVRRRELRSSDPPPSHSKPKDN